MFPVLLTVVLGAIGAGALIIMGLVYWGRKQDHLGEMTHFCLKYLVHSEDESERCAMAKALGKANDPGALLVLFDVALDEEEAEAVRKAAREALHEMGADNRKYQEVVADFEIAAEQRNFPSIIGILIANFEHDGTGYAQSAYIIARQYIRLELYVDAWEWLEKADIRNQRTNLYGNQIKQWMRFCNTHLLEEADDSYRNANYQSAKEQYAVLDHSLSEADMRHCAVYLRSACVFTKLKEYQNADQSLLQALAKHHETELTLTLIPLLQEIQGLPQNEVGSYDKRNAMEIAIDERASVIMNVLLEKTF
jgi:hypothetical protein